MTTPIDLDLVELRCKLMGWRLFRYEDGTMYVRGELGVCVAAFYAGRWVGAEYALMERPRLTLADIIADPGEGWTGQCGAETWVMEWRTYVDAPSDPWLVRLQVDEAGRLSGLLQYNLDTDWLIEAHRAVTDLLIKLAEVSDV
jgi:hypothetical protein